MATGALIPAGRSERGLKARAVPAARIRNLPLPGFVSADHVDGAYLRITLT
jgi:hypothetical protein